jgi:hypothetical protein
MPIVAALRDLVVTFVATLLVVVRVHVSHRVLDMWVGGERNENEI